MEITNQSYIWHYLTYGYGCFCLRSSRKLEHCRDREEQLGFDRSMLPQSACALANCVTVGTIGAPLNTRTRYTSSMCVYVVRWPSSTLEKLLKFFACTVRRIRSRGHSYHAFIPLKVQGITANFFERL